MEEQGESFILNSNHRPVSHLLVLFPECSVVSVRSHVVFGCLLASPISSVLPRDWVSLLHHVAVTPHLLLEGPSGGEIPQSLSAQVHFTLGLCVPLPSTPQEADDFNFHNALKIFSG